MKISLTATIACLLLTSASCSKDDDLTTLYYDDTACFDPWDNSTDEPAAAIRAYFEEEGIAVDRISVDESGGLAEVCLACHCQTGDVYVASVRSGDVSRLEEQGWRTDR